MVRRQKTFLDATSVRALKASIVIFQLSSNTSSLIADILVAYFITCVNLKRNEWLLQYSRLSFHRRSRENILEFGSHVSGLILEFQDNFG